MNRVLKGHPKIQPQTVDMLMIVDVLSSHEPHMRNSLSALWLGITPQLGPQAPGLVAKVRTWLCSSTFTGAVKGGQVLA